MHLYFISRGVKHQRDLWVNWMQTQLFSWERTNKTTGKKEVIPLQGALRPVELWEYVFPEEHLNQVLNNMMFTNEGLNCYKHVKGKNLSMAVLRKSLGAKPIPKFPVMEINKMMRMNGVAVEPIGIRADKRGDLLDPSTGTVYEQELL